MNSYSFTAMARERLKIEARRALREQQDKLLLRPLSRACQNSVALALKKTLCDHPDILRGRFKLRGADMVTVQCRACKITAVFPRSIAPLG